jgi:hypothetical protein
MIAFIPEELDAGMLAESLSVPDASADAAPPFIVSEDPVFPHLVDFDRLSALGTERGSFEPAFGESFPRLDVEPRAWRWGGTGDGGLLSHGYGLFDPRSALEADWRTDDGFGGGIDLTREKRSQEAAPSIPAYVPPVVFVPAPAAPAALPAPVVTTYDSWILVPYSLTGTGTLRATDNRYASSSLIFSATGGSTLGSVYKDSGAIDGLSLSADGTFTVRSGYINAKASGIGVQGEFVGNSVGTLSNGLPGAFDRIVTVTDPSGASATLHLMGTFLQLGVIATASASGHAVGAYQTAGAVEHLDAGGHAVSNLVVVQDVSGSGGALQTGLPVLQAARDGSGDVFVESWTQNVGTGAFDLSVARYSSTGAVVNAPHVVYSGTAVVRGDGSGIHDGSTVGLISDAASGAHMAAVGTDGSLATVWTDYSGGVHRVRMLILESDTSVRQSLVLEQDLTVGGAGTREWAKVTALSGGGYATSWVRYNATTNDNSLIMDIRDANGVSVSGLNQIGIWNGADGDYDLVGIPSGGVAIAFRDGAGNSSIQFWTAAGTLIPGNTVSQVHPGVADDVPPVLFSIAANDYMPNGGVGAVLENGTAYRIYDVNGSVLYSGGFTAGVTKPDISFASASISQDDSGVWLEGRDAGGNLVSWKLSVGTSLDGSALNLTLGDGNNFISDTSLADVVTTGKGTNTLVTTQGADVFHVEQGANTIIIGYSRLNDSTKATITGFSEANGDVLKIGDAVGAGAIDANHFRLISANGTDTSHVYAQVRQNGGDPWHTVADMTGMKTTDGTLTGSAQAIAQAQLDAAAQHMIDTNHVVR